MSTRQSYHVINTYPFNNALPLVSLPIRSRALSLPHYLSPSFLTQSTSRRPLPLLLPHQDPEQQAPSSSTSMAPQRITFLPAILFLRCASLPHAGQRTTTPAAKWPWSSLAAKRSQRPSPRRGRGSLQQAMRAPGQQHGPTPAGQASSRRGHRGPRQARRCPLPVLPPASASSSPLPGSMPSLPPPGREARDDDGRAGTGGARAGGDDRAGNGRMASSGASAKMPTVLFGMPKEKVRQSV